MQTVKKAIFQALESNDLAPIIPLVKTNRRLLAQLVRFAYDKETLIGWRAIKAIGVAARAMAKTEYAFLRETIRKQLWHLTDESGGIGWSGPEILGEIVSADPEGFKDIIPLIVEVYDIEEKVFRPGIVYALIRIAEASPEHVLPFKEIAIRALGDSDPAVRVNAINLLALIGNKLESHDKQRILERDSHLKVDKAEVWLYRNDTFENVQVAEEWGIFTRKWDMKL